MEQQESAASSSLAWTLRLLSDDDPNLADLTLVGTGALIVGRGAEADLLIPSTHASRSHAEIRVCGQVLQVRDLNSVNGTFINRNRVQSGEAVSGDRLCFGPLCFEVVAPALQGIDSGATAVISPSDVHRSRGSATLIMPLGAQLFGRTSPVKGKRVPLAGERITVGRAPDNTLAIDHSSVSAHHAEILFAKGEWHLRDLRSTNGSHVDGRRITNAALKSGQLIAIGQVEFEFALAGSLGRASEIPSRVNTKLEIRRHRPWLLGTLLLFCILLLLAYPPSFVERLLPRSIVKAHTALQRDMESTVWNYAQQFAKEKSGTPPDVALLREAHQFSRTRNFVTPTLAPLRAQGLDIIVLDSMGGLTAIEGDSGAEIFSVNLGARVVAPPVQLTLADGSTALVVARYDGRVALFNAKGEQLWMSAEGLGLGRLVLRPLILDVNGDGHQDVIVVSEKRGIVALDGERKGWLLWDTAALVRGDLTLPLAADINGDGHLDFVSAGSDGQVLAFTVERGAPRKLWEQQLSPVLFAAPVLAQIGGQPRIVVAAHQRSLVALRPDTGAIDWHRQISKTLFASPLGADLNADGNTDLITVAADGEVRAYRGETGEPLWRHELGVEVQSNALLFDFDLDGSADVLVLDTKGAVHLIGGRQGEPLTESFKQSEGFVFTPLLGDVDGDGRVNLVLLSTTGELAVLTTNRRLRSPQQQWLMDLGNDYHAFRDN